MNHKGNTRYNIIILYNVIHANAPVYAHPKCVESRWSAAGRKDIMVYNYHMDLVINAVCTA